MLSRRRSRFSKHFSWVPHSSNRFANITTELGLRDIVNDLQLLLFRSILWRRNRRRYVYAGPLDHAHRTDKDVCPKSWRTFGERVSVSPKRRFCPRFCLSFSYTRQPPRA